MIGRRRGLPDGHTTRDMAADGKWFRISIDSVPVSYTGYRRWLYPPLLRLARTLLRETAEASDDAVAIGDFGAVTSDASDGRERE